MQESDIHWTLGDDDLYDKSADTRKVFYSQPFVNSYTGALYMLLAHVNSIKAYTIMTGMAGVYKSIKVVGAYDNLPETLEHLSQLLLSP